MITNTVLERGKPRFNMVGQKLPDSLHDTNQQISQGLVKRLYRYALKRLNDSGFYVPDWDCEVYTADGRNPPAHRFYVVEFTNPKGGQLGVQGILTQHGWPFLDHGLCIEG